MANETIDTRYTEQNDYERDKNVNILIRGILIAAIYETTDELNLASVQDAINKIAEISGVDLTTSTDRKKFQEGCRKVAIQYLSERNLIEEIKDGDSVRYQIVKGKEQDYIDELYKAKFNKETAKNIKHLLEASKKFKKARQFIDTQNEIVGAGLAAATSINVLKIADAFEDFGDNVIKKSVDITKDAAMRTLYPEWDTYDDKKKKDIKKFIKRQTKKGKNTYSLYNRFEAKTKDEDSDGTIKNAKLEHEDLAKKKLNLTLGDGSTKLIRGADVVVSLENIANGYQEDMFSAFEELDKLIRPGAKEVTFDDVSEKVKHEFGKNKIPDVNPVLDSCSAGAMSLIRYIKDVSPRLMNMKLISLMKKTEKKIPLKAFIYLREKLENREIRIYEKKKNAKVMRDEFHRATINIAHFNSINEGAEERGKNFANEYAELNLYRCGISENLVSSLDFFQMNTLDKIWAIAYMEAGMIKSSQGIRYLGKSYGPDLENINKAALENNQKQLQQKAKEIFEKYTKGKAVDELDKVCDDMSRELVEKHENMVQEINKEREENHLKPLERITHFCDSYNNAKDTGKKDKLLTKQVTAEEFNENKNFITETQSSGKYDAIMVTNKDERTLLLLNEEKGIVGIVNDQKIIEKMEATKQIQPVDDRAKPSINCERERITTKLKTEKLINQIGTSKDNEMDKVNEKREQQPIIEILIKNDFECKIKEDGDFQIMQVEDEKTGRRVQIDISDTGLNYEHHDLENFAKSIAKQEYEQKIQNNFIPKEELNCPSLINAPSKLNQKILSIADPENKLIEMFNFQNSISGNLNPEIIFNKKKRTDWEKQLDEIFSKDNIQKFDDAKQKYNQLLNDYNYIAAFDPALAQCKLNIPSCERHDKIFVAYTKDGIAVEYGPNAKNIDQNNQEEIELQQKLASTIAAMPNKDNVKIQDADKSEKQADVPKNRREFEREFN